MNRYVALWNGERIELKAKTSYEAQKLATVALQKGTRKKVKGYDVTVVLCEKDGEQVVHTPDF